MENTTKTNRNSMACQLCGSDMGTFNVNGNHNLCQALASHDMPTPSLGTRCPTCDGTGTKPFANASIGMTQQQLTAWEAAITCKDCNGSGKAAAKANNE